MSTKRSRTQFEADLQTKHSPYVFYGSPLPPLDPDTRDDGSFQPVWKQEVRDEQGRKRLHGAFTGGFSAGYFNTVGSKEGWTPATFVSSRSNRKKDEKSAQQQRPEDFMDDEDLADASEARKLEIDDGFAGLGSTELDGPRYGTSTGLFRPEGDTAGTRLLQKMGWRQGQGIGPKIRRKALLGNADVEDLGEDHLFAPKNTNMVAFVKKNDHQGIGFHGEARLSIATNRPLNDDTAGEEEGVFGTSLAVVKTTKKKKPMRTGIGIGILNDTGSDDEDPYDIGPNISYGKVLGGSKKNKTVANGAFKPVFKSKKTLIAQTAVGFRKCHDGRLPLDGFVLSKNVESLTSTVSTDEVCLLLEIPDGWTSSRSEGAKKSKSRHLSTVEAAKSSTLDAKSRAALLGEAPLPGKSVFDFLSTAARDRVAAASGKSNLPAALGEIPEGYNVPPEDRQRDLYSQVPRLNREIAVTALARGASGWMPYAEDEPKRSRYRSYLEYQAGLQPRLQELEVGKRKDDWIKELHEFAHCAQIFKPMTGMMASRFTSSSSSTPSGTGIEPSTTSSTSLVSKPAAKPEDPAEAAARVGMFGHMTRSSQNFFPTRLLCKRFNVKPPAHVQLDPERTTEDGGGIETASDQTRRDLDLVPKSAIDDMMKQHWDNANLARRTNDVEGDVVPAAEPPKEVAVDIDRNDALEGKKAGEAVFRAIFGDSDDDDED